MQDFTSEFSKIFRGSEGDTLGGPDPHNDPLPHPTHSPNLGPLQLTPVDQQLLHLTYPSPAQTETLRTGSYCTVSYNHVT